MKAKDLITYLQQCNPDTEVVCHEGGSTYDSRLRIYKKILERESTFRYYDVPQFIRELSPRPRSDEEVIVVS